MRFHPRLKSILTVNFVIVGICPVIVMGYIAFHLMTKSLENDAIHESALLAESQADGITRYLLEPKAELAQIAHLVKEGLILRPSSINGFLETSVALYPSISEIQIVDRNGSIRYAAPLRENAKETDLSGKPFFEMALTARKPYLFPSIFLSQIRSPTLVMTSPLDQGMVVGYISLKPLNAMMSRAKIGEKGYAAVIDGQGVIIAHSDPSLPGKRMEIDHFPIVTREFEKKETAIHYDFREKEMLGCITVLPALKWRILVIQPLDAAFAPMNRLRNILLGGVFVALILALAIAFFSRRKIVGPIQRLISDAAKIAKGDFDIPPHEKGYPEIDELGNDFRVMASSLKSRELALQKSEDRYRNLVENSFDGIFVQNGSRIIFANQRLHEMLGYEPGELKGREPWIICHPEFRHITRERTRARLRGEAVKRRYELKLLRKDGSWFFGEIYAKVIHLDGRPGIQVWISDLTHRKEAEAAVLKSEKRFRDLFNSISDLIYTQDLEGRFLSVNPAMCALFGYDLQKFLGRKASEFMDPELRPLFRTEYLEKLQKEGLFKGVSGYFAKDGRKIFIEYHSTLVKPDDGEWYISGTGRDVTERVKAKKQLKSLREQVAQAEKMKAVGVLAGGVAHDFNNLLMGIQGNASLILLDMDKNSPHYDKLKGIETYVQQGSNLTRQLLGFARGGKYEITPTDLNSFLKDELMLFQRTHKDVVIQTTYDEHVWIVDVDRGQLTQTLLNLFINARQAMPGGGELCVQTDNVTVDGEQGRLHQVAPGKYVRISIKDSGMGMDKSTLGHIFEPFFTTKEMGRGTGLGLASVYGTIKNHGGFLHVESEPGKGTAFYVYLPASHSQLKESKKEDGAGLFQGNGEKILMVDDEEMILEVGGEMLKRLGYSVITTTKGEAAIDIMQKEREAVSLVILDMIMPGMGGGETYDRLRKIKTDVRVLLSSGYSIDGEARKILDRGCNGFIQKPFTLKKLSQTVRKTLGNPSS